MARRSIDLDALEREALEQSSLPLAVLAKSVREAEQATCVGCGLFAGSAAGFRLTREQCERLKIEHGDGPDGPLMVVPMCRRCDERCDLNAAYAEAIEERIMGLAERGKTGMLGVRRTS